MNAVRNVDEFRRAFKVRSTCWVIELLDGKPARVNPHLITGFGEKVLRGERLTTYSYTIRGWEHVMTDVIQEAIRGELVFTAEEDAVEYMAFWLNTEEDRPSQDDIWLDEMLEEDLVHLDSVSWDDLEE